MYEKFGQFIDGKWQKSEKNQTYEVINPATEEIIGKASKAGRSDVEKALKSAEKGLKVWRNTAPWQRSNIIRKIADKIREKQNVLAKWLTLEVGKPLAEGVGEAGGAADIFEGNGPVSSLFMLGYAGWYPGQLEKEIMEDSWLVVNADPKLVFNKSHSQKYNLCLKLLGIENAYFSSDCGKA